VLKSAQCLSDPRLMNRLNTTLLILLCVLIIAKSAFAEVLRWPQGCLTGELHVQNNSDSETRAWLQKFKSQLLEESEVRLARQQVTLIPVSAETVSESFTLLHFKKAGTLHAKFICNDNNIIKTYPSHSFEGGVLSYRRSDLKQNKLWIQNLYSGNNQIELEFLDRRMNVLSNSSIALISLETKVIPLISESQNWSYVRVQSQQRFAAFNLTSYGSDGPFIIAPQSTLVSEDAAYFEVRSQDNIGDSFIAKITDPEMIAKAREQITNPTLEKILFARLKKGHGNHNRNWSKREKSFWSWSVSEVTNIADIGSTSCNGLPQVVEDRIDSWIENPGRICFWSYRIRKELKPSEVASGFTIQ